LAVRKVISREFISKVASKALRMVGEQVGSIVGSWDHCGMDNCIPIAKTKYFEYNAVQEVRQLLDPPAPLSPSLVPPPLPK